MNIRVPLAITLLFGVPTQSLAQEEMAVPVESGVVEVREDPTAAELTAETQVVMLGTGTPIPDAYRGGASIAVIHKGEAYLFDVGAGAVRNAAHARYKYDIPSLYPTAICCVFLTHLHSDHTLDFSELAYTMWWRRLQQLHAWGPKGLQELATGMQMMMAPDARLRSSGTQPIFDNTGYTVDVTEIADGFVYEKDDLRIQAFSVNHGDIDPAFGYRITTADRTIVISGDTAVSSKLMEMASGVDILFHEVISDTGLIRTSEAFQEYHNRSHTTATNLGKLAAQVKPDLLVLYHGLYYGMPESIVVEEIKSVYDGNVVLADDLDKF
jgi:ribonuclease Z